uniref:Uncharacterized protein n=1 Tax=Romanomermis culicivorax TaxID=13658 RepID=A0A915KMF0_ROMCU
MKDSNGQSLKQSLKFERNNLFYNQDNPYFILRTRNGSHVQREKFVDVQIRYIADYRSIRVPRIFGRLISIYRAHQIDTDLYVSQNGQIYFQPGLQNVERFVEVEIWTDSLLLTKKRKRSRILQSGDYGKRFYYKYCLYNNQRYEMDHKFQNDKELRHVSTQSGFRQLKSFSTETLLDIKSKGFHRRGWPLLWTRKADDKTIKTSKMKKITQNRMKKIIKVFLCDRSSSFSSSLISFDAFMISIIGILR